MVSIATGDTPIDSLTADSEQEVRQQQQRNRNLTLCYYLILGRQLQAAIRRDFLDIYLYDITGVNEFVGKVESTTGTVSLLVLLPLGFLADKLDRLRVLKAVSALKLIPTVILLAGTHADAIGLLWPGLVCLSVLDAAIEVTLQVVIVDNVPEPEKRIRVLSRKEAVTWASNALGPLLVLLLISIQGDQGSWSLGLSRSVVRGALFLYFVTEPAAFLLRAVGARTASTTSATSAVPAWAEEPVACACGMRKRWLVPIWSDFIWAVTQVGASVSLRYIPLFFRHAFGLSPAGLLWLRVLENGSLASVVYTMPALVRFFGRGVTCVLLVLMGGIFMYGVVLAGSVVLAALLFVLRTCTARAWLSPLQSIIFECVAAEHRGRWSAITSFKSASNGLGAWLGGALADSTGGYRTGFSITATAQCISALAFVPVLVWLPSQRAAAQEVRGARDPLNSSR